MELLRHCSQKWADFVEEAEGINAKVLLVMLELATGTLVIVEFIHHLLIR